MATMHVTGRGGDQYEIRIGDHTVTVDQPVDNGGTDTGPTPTDLFVASLASCAAHSRGGSCAATACPRRGSRWRARSTWRRIAPPASASSRWTCTPAKRCHRS